MKERERLRYRERRKRTEIKSRFYPLDKVQGEIQ